MDPIIFEAIVASLLPEKSALHHLEEIVGEDVLSSIRHDIATNVFYLDTFQRLWYKAHARPKFVLQAGEVQKVFDTLHIKGYHMKAWILKQVFQKTFSAGPAYIPGSIDMMGMMFVTLANCLNCTKCPRKYNGKIVSADCTVVDITRRIENGVSVVDFDVVIDKDLLATEEVSDNFYSPSLPSISQNIFTSEDIKPDPGISVCKVEVGTVSAHVLVSNSPAPDANEKQSSSKKRSLKQNDEHSKRKKHDNSSRQSPAASIEKRSSPPSSVSENQEEFRPIESRMILGPLQIVGVVETLHKKFSHCNQEVLLVLFHQNFADPECEEIIKAVTVLCSHCRVRKEIKKFGVPPSMAKLRAIQEKLELDSSFYSNASYIFDITSDGKPIVEPTGCDLLQLKEVSRNLDEIVAKYNNIRLCWK